MFSIGSSGNNLFYNRKEGWTHDYVVTVLIVSDYIRKKSENIKKLGVLNLKPIVIEFQDDVELVNKIKELSQQGVPKEDLYVISHDDDRTKRVADKADANTIGLEEVGVSTAMGNLFRKKGDELRAKFKEIGFSEMESNELEGKLDQGKVLLIHKPKAE